MTFIPNFKTLSDIKVSSFFKIPDRKILPVTFLNFGESSIDFRVFIGAIDYSGQWSVTHEFIKRLHKRFKIEGIEIPYPIRTVYNKNDK